MSDVQATTHSRHVPEGSTRDCLDPWVYIEVKANGDVAPCCVRPAVGNLNVTKLSAILMGPAMRQLRRALLEGRLDRPCQSCGLRASTSPAVLSQRVRALFEAMTVPPDFDGAAYLAANPDVAKAGVDPEVHFLRFGRLEGRPLKPTR